MADTTPVIIIHDNKAVDSAKFIQEIYRKVLTNKISFTTFNAKVKVAYNSKEGSEDATAYIRVRKDSAIWISFHGPLGIEGFRVLVTQDSVKVINYLKKNIQNSGINYLQQMTGVPVDFITLQDIVIGNPVFIDSNIISYQINNDNQLLVLMSGKLFNNLVTIDNTDHKILRSKLDDINMVRNRSVDIGYTNYDNAAGIAFARHRSISLTDESKLDVNLDFKQYTFNQPLTFPFNIPKNYKRF